MGNTVAKVDKTPPKQARASKQYDLFTSFFGDASQLSNTIELWDAIPKYAVSARKQNALRDEKGRLDVLAQPFEYRPQGADSPMPCVLKVQPAAIEVEAGVYQDFYPSQNEELIEEVLKKLFSDARYGQHIARESESWVKFTLGMIQKELAARGRSRSIDEIKRSLEIMSRSIYEVEMQGRSRGVVYTNPILSNMARVHRSDYIDDPKAMWAAQLPALISKSVNELSYRQFNYALHMNLSTPLVRWLHKRLVHRYRNANITESYHFTFSSVVASSQLLTHPRKNANLDAIEAALIELQEKKIIFKYEADIRRQGRTITDVVYDVWATVEFRDEVKAANARAKKNRHAVEQATKDRNALLHRR